MTGGFSRALLEATIVRKPVEGSERVLAMMPAPQQQKTLEPGEAAASNGPSREPCTADVRTDARADRSRGGSTRTVHEGMTVTAQHACSRFPGPGEPYDGTGFPLVAEQQTRRAQTALPQGVQVRILPSGPQLKSLFSTPATNQGDLTP